MKLKKLIKIEIKPPIKFSKYIKQVQRGIFLLKRERGANILFSNNFPVLIYLCVFSFPRCIIFHLKDIFISIAYYYII